MEIESNVFELKCYHKIYMLKASSILCSVKSEFIGNVQNNFVFIKPYDLEDFRLVQKSLTEDRIIYTESIQINDETDSLLTEFRGVIIGYPYFKLLVTILDINKTFECDVIQIRGGRKTWCGFENFNVDFVFMKNNGEVERIFKLDSSDVDKRFHIEQVPKIGSLLSERNYLLHPITVEEFINGKKESYMGLQPYKWEEVKGTVSGDFHISALKMKINFDSRIVRLYYSENLYKRTYEVISHASMDPGNDECTESTDMYIWGAFIFNESYLVNFIKKLASSHLVSFLNGSSIVFKEHISKSQFVELTGVNLFESIINSRY